MKDLIRNKIIFTLLYLSFQTIVSYIPHKKKKMMNPFTSLFLFSLSVHCFVACLASNTKNITTDEFSLLAFKSLITLDPFNILSNNWSTSSSLCNWVGVTCDEKHNRVHTLNLKNMGLRGTISPNLGNLSFLVILDLSGNSLQGQIPKEIFLLRRLKVLDISYNEFVGEIPTELGDLTELQNLYLGINNFSGLIPQSIHKLSKLEQFDCAINLFQGSIPLVIGQLSRLEVLDLSYNMLSGHIPQSITNLTSLQEMYLSSNYFSGTFYIKCHIYNIFCVTRFHLFYKRELSSNLINNFFIFI